MKSTRTGIHEAAEERGLETGVGLQETGGGAPI